LLSKLWQFDTALFLVVGFGDQEVENAFASVSVFWGGLSLMLLFMSHLSVLKLKNLGFPPFLIVISFETCTQKASVF
jgi:hypothetical protein